MKVIEAQQAFIILSQAKIEGLTVEQKYKVMNVARTLKSHAKDFEDFIKDTQEKVTDAKEQNAILTKEAEREIEVTFEKLGDMFDKLLEVNGWNVTQSMLLEDLIK